MKLKRIVYISLAAAAVALAGDDQGSIRPPQEPQRIASRVPHKLQPDDEITVHSLRAKELAEKLFRIDQNGDVNFPLIGRLTLDGQTATEAEHLIAEKLSKFYLDPDVELSVSALHTEPVSVLGAVGSPGIHTTKGKMTLLDVLSASGGIRGDAGSVIVVTREEQYGAIPYPNVRLTPSGDSIAEVRIKELLDAQDPRGNFTIMPHDVISIPPGQMVYVEGNVKHAGGFPLSGKTGISVIQAIALAEGLDPRAAPEKVHIMRRVGEEQKLIPVNVKKVLAGKAEDLALKPNDILFVPNSTQKVITTRTVEAAIGIVSGILIFSHP
jgi:polysaccharide export outer membrane protein